MSGYVKIWTDIRNDSWFVGLKLNERGLWYELLVIAKVRGDSGRFFIRSRAALAQEVGGDRSSVARILAGFRTAGKISITETDGGQVEITIPNYVYWQELTKDGVKDKLAQNRRKTADKTLLPDQTRPDQSRPDQTNRETPSAPIVNSNGKTPDLMREELAPIFGWDGKKKKEVVWFDYLSAALDWVCAIYPGLQKSESVKKMAGDIIKTISVNAFHKPEKFHRSWPPIEAYVAFLHLAIGEPSDDGGLLAHRNYPPKPDGMYQFVNQIFTDGQQSHEYAHAAYHKAGLV